MDKGSYTCGTSEFPLLGMTMGEMIDHIAAEYPETEAIVSAHQNIRWTYREFLEEIDRVARALMGLGVEKGDRVGIWAMNHAEWVVVQFATAKIGAIMVNINPAYRTVQARICPQAGRDPDPHPAGQVQDIGLRRHVLRGLSRGLRQKRPAISPRRSSRI